MIANIMNYDGYMARVDLDTDDQILVGRILGINDIVTFHADSVPEIRKAFEESVDDYLV